MPTPSRYDLIIFDCDGTLVDSEELNCRSCSEALAEAGFADYPPEVIYQRFVGRKLSDIFAVIGQETGRALPEDMAGRVIARVSANAPLYLKALPGAAAGMEAAATHAKICVASNGERTNVLNALAITGMNRFAPEGQVYTSALVPKGKPAPDIFLYAARQANVAPENCLVIEDTIAGVTAARAAGMRVIGYTAAHMQEAGYAEKLLAAGADRVMRDWSEFPDFLMAR